MSQQNGKKDGYKEVGGIDITGSTLDFSEIRPNKVEIKNFMGANYELWEASGATAIEYRTAVIKCQKLAPNGEVIGLDESFLHEIPTLVSKCLFKANGDGKVSLKGGVPDPKERVSEDIIKGWMNRVQWALFEKLKEISPKLLEEASDEETIEKQIADLQEKLKEIKSKKKERELKNLQGSSLAGSS